LMSLSIDQYTATGEVAGPRQTLLTGRYACYDLYQARDGGWISVGAIEPQFFANLCTALGCEHYAKRQMEDDAQDEIRAAFSEAFKRRDRDDWVAELAPNNTCVAPVYDLTELADDPHYAARGIFMKARHPEHGEFRQVGPILAGGDRDQPMHEVRPVGETDAEALLTAAGYGTEEIQALRESGAVE